MQAGLPGDEVQRLADLGARIHDAMGLPPGIHLGGFTPPHPVPRDSAPGAELEAADAAEPVEPAEPAADDDHANQRWLAGRGMLQLKDFIAQHGADESVWRGDADVDSTPVWEYVDRIKRLRARQSRDFILNYALKQGAGAEASDLIKRYLEAY